MFMNREIVRNMFIEIELRKNTKEVCNKPVFKKVDNDFMKNSNCLKCICIGNNCRDHNKL